MVKTNAFERQREIQALKLASQGTDSKQEKILYERGCEYLSLRGEVGALLCFWFIARVMFYNPARSPESRRLRTVGGLVEKFAFQRRWNGRYDPGGG